MPSIKVWAYSNESGTLSNGGQCIAASSGGARLQARAVLASWVVLKGPGSQTRMMNSACKTASADSHCRAPLRPPLPPALSLPRILHSTCWQMTGST